MDRTTRQEIKKDINKLNTINELDLTDIYRTPHTSAAVYIIFSRAHGTSPRIDHKTNLNTSEKTEIL